MASSSEADELNTAAQASTSLQDTKVDLSAPVPLPRRESQAVEPGNHITHLNHTTAATSTMALKDPLPRCLFFDVFGTCVDWRKTVTDTLWEATRQALSSREASIASRVRMRASDMTYEQWGEVAQEWRNTYLAFTRSIANDPSKTWKTVDQHHLDALRDILTERKLINPPDPTLDKSNVPLDLIEDGSLWNEAQIKDLSLVWHRLAPWPDTCRGIQELNRMFWTCTLTNGNLSLIREMAAHGKMEFTHIFSAEMFNSYKPNPKIYFGAAEKLGLQPSECVLVAAHLDDLKAAKGCGYRTVYVERPREERYPELIHEDGIVDVHVTMDEDGFVAAARKLGIEVDDDEERRRSASAPPVST